MSEDISFSHGLVLKSGWVKPNALFPHKVIHKPTQRLWKGMHPWIRDHFDNKFQGTVTHYDALGSALRTATGFCSSPVGASTHFVIDRNGDLYQLASIHDRTWHAGQNSDEWSECGGQYTMPNGEKTKSPNQWFLGIDLSNWGYLNYDKASHKYYSWTKTEVPSSRVGFDAGGKPWELYQLDALDTYGDLIWLLSSELGIKAEMHVGHSDVAPKNKVDPGPLLHHRDLITEIYEAMSSHEPVGVDHNRRGSESDI